MRANDESTSPASRAAKETTVVGTVCLVLIAALLCGAGCSRVSVHTMADPEANFGAYSTFDFLPDGGQKERPRNLPPRLALLKDPLYYAHVQQAIESDLVSKGLRRVRDGGRPDLLVGYRTVIKDRADVAPPLYGVGWRGRVYVARPAHVRWYKQGTLVIDIIDRASDHLVWRSVGVGAMRDLRPGPDLQDAIGEVLAEFPPD